MRKPILIPLFVIAIAATAGLAAAPAAAQPVGGTSIGIEAGLPLVLGAEVATRLDARTRVGLGLGRLSGLTALRAEARWLIRPEARERLTPSLIVGAEQYFLKQGDRSSTPVGIHAAVGFDYFFASPVSFGVRIGGMHTFGSSGSGDVKVFSVENGFTTGTFNMAVRYHL